MTLYCFLGMHRPGYWKVFNFGLLFTHCVECRKALVEEESGWKALPSGLKLVWRKRRPQDIFFHVLPNHRRRRLPLRLPVPWRPAGSTRYHHAADANLYAPARPTSWPPPPPIDATDRLAFGAPDLGPYARGDELAPLDD